MNRPNIGIPESGHGVTDIKPQYCSGSGFPAEPAKCRANVESNVFSRGALLRGRPSFSSVASLLLAAVKVLRAREVVELRVLADERQPNRPDRTVTLFADDDLSRALVGAVGVVNLVAVDEEDHVRVLFDSARFAQVRHHRTLVGTLLQTS